MNKRPEGAIRLAYFIVFGIIVLLIGCQQVKQEKTLADLYPDYSVFSPSRLAHGEIAIEDANGKFEKGVEIARLQFSEEALILLDNVRAAPEITVRELSEQIERSTTALPLVRCSTTWVYANEKFVVDNCIFSNDPVMVGSYQGQTNASLPAEPFLKAKLARNLREGTFYRCKYTTTGAIVCRNSCSCAGCIACEFQSSDGLLVVNGVKRPDRDADSSSRIPCNSMNQCN